MVQTTFFIQNLFLIIANKKDTTSELPTQNSVILSKLRGKDGVEVVIENGTPIIKSSPENNNNTLTLKFLYGCGMPKEQIIQEAGEDRRMDSYKFMQFFGKEDMEKYGVLF